MSSDVGISLLLLIELVKGSSKVGSVLRNSIKTELLQNAGLPSATGFLARLQLRLRAFCASAYLFTSGKNIPGTH